MGTNSSTAPQSRSQHLGALVISLVLVGAVSALGGISSAGATAKYGTLAQPSWAPPSHLFGPVWTVLYVLMAVAAWLVWRTDPRWSNPAIAVYGVQLALNLAWSPLFFGLGWRGLALVDILVLDIAVAITIALFWKAHRTAAVLLLPYFGWILFATALNYSVWSLNS
ncbi:TspO/MBR family protein [Mycolicibacter hiberniae]|uniref:Putative TspO/MBR-related protein n=1 Tax=Mycolicibacter hiberniae TaxID=29314 RepID=A0A7I7WZL1_9MYCO|nr:TspO/MBR family protein [Mycolicibacter hiberniae]MCV7084401.1 tryptophan-rich sensory protein [Mycolicibacter hiberniae]ORV67203.1 peripheral-type benzodiazepine receptor [Mycolicibacter hiberniae]BBZ22934.1 putative TspO/MBR-related protein precursor [Mycolicibacter hiberniae]